MNSINFSVVVCLFVASHLLAGDTIELFNGKDLTGWHKVGGTGEYKVENGVIRGFGEKIKGNTFLTTDKSYDNFILEMEARVEMDEKMNSGIQFRSSDVNNHLKGYQYEFENKHENNTGGVYDEHGTRGFIDPFIPCKWIKSQKPIYNELVAKHGEAVKAFQKQTREAFKPRGWNKIKIRCQGGHVQTWLNGVKQADFNDGEGEGYKSGVIGLQLHSGKKCDVSWRNIRLTPLPAK